MWVLAQRRRSSTRADSGDGGARPPPSAAGGRARCRGMTTPNMSRWAQRHGIQRRPPGLASTAANLKTTDDAEQAPELLRPALRQIGGAARLNRFETVLADPTLTAAAADLGLRQAALTPPDRPIGGGPRRGFNSPRPTRTTDDPHRAGCTCPTGVEGVEALPLTPGAEPQPVRTIKAGLP